MAAQDETRPAQSLPTERQDGQRGTAGKPSASILDQLPHVAASQVLPKYVTDRHPELCGEWARIGFRSLCTLLSDVVLGQADTCSQSAALALEVAHVMARPAALVVALDGKVLSITEDGGAFVLGDRSLYIKRRGGADG